MYLDRPIGIDLGTTNSAVALLEPDGRELLLHEDKFHRKVVPSVVAWDPAQPEGDLLVGFKAWHRRGLDPEPVVSIKRKMGSQAPVAVGPIEMSPEQVSAEILRAVRLGMRETASAKLDGYQLSLTRAVVTVPAYFDAPQIEATRRAAEVAGLEVLGLLQEPTAAAMHYVWKHGITEGTFMVYDLGGGTFDVSIIRSLLGEYQVLGIHGDNYLGGDDFDRRFAEFLRARLVEEGGYSLDLDVHGDDDDATRFLVLTRIAREVKEALSSSSFQYIGRRDIFRDHKDNSVTLDLEVSREQWDELMLSYVETTIACCRSALELATESAGVGLEDIDHVLMVGGSSRVPLVQRCVADAFCGEGRSKAEAPILDDPDTCVALGAAIHAANIGGLTLGDNERGVAVNISSPLATRRDVARIVGEVNGDAVAEVSGLSLVRVDEARRQTVARSAVEDGRFKLTEIAVPDDGTHVFDLELHMGDLEPVRFPIALFKGGDVRRTGSALSNPSVLAKDIYLEVVKLGHPDRKLLVGHGESLPVSARFRFYTADQSGAIVLRILQERLLIKTIHLQVPPELSIGTPVDLVIKVDEAMEMVAEGGVGDQVFWVKVEPPPEQQVRSWAEIEVLLEDADRVASSLWGNEAAYVRTRLEYLKAGIKEAAQTDRDKVQVIARRLTELLEDYRSEDTELTPSYSHFEWINTLIRRRVFRVGEDEQPLGLSADQWRAKLEGLEDEGKTAYAQQDQRAWTRVTSQGQAIWESLAQDEHRFTNPNSPDSLQRSLLSAQYHVEHIKENLAVLVLSSNEDTRQLQQREKLALLDALNTEVIAALELYATSALQPSEARTALERIHAALRRVDRRLERLPSLGLVAEG